MPSRCTKQFTLVVVAALDCHLDFILHSQLPSDRKGSLADNEGAGSSATHRRFLLTDDETADFVWAFEYFVGILQAGETAAWIVPNLSAALTTAYPGFAANMTIEPNTPTVDPSTPVIDPPDEEHFGTLSCRCSANDTINYGTGANEASGTASVSVDLVLNVA